ncbi:class I SAM-dependent methyltransferase [Dactylosporangium roseum]|uniref:Class I SAM-dependent methyltransferase n=1 Tax=Dactylosporangium roseum TaxID=47989 RepID=A0ABY5ZFJ9_9ACTN|nr:class I SAM-dependent methyltransferase [Dactylosporangium roseum]UWZ39453.1 class I SAM-dependent methyltransferase [Dactylosporangium roseum]
MIASRPGSSAPRDYRNARRQTIDLATVLRLYRTHAEALGAARDAQRGMLCVSRGMRPKLDDIEAELTYLLVRDAKPARVVEIGTFHGWSTSWLLRAVADNATGHLDSYDIVDHVLRTIPGDLSGDRWTFHRGDVRARADLQPSTINYLFIDAAHTARFARWYTHNLLDNVRAGTPVTVHDVFHRARTRRFSEGRVVLDWLAQRNISYFTASAKAAPHVYEEILAVRRSLGLSEAVHKLSPNPMIYFTTR